MNEYTFSHGRLALKTPDYMTKANHATVKSNVTETAYRTAYAPVPDEKLRTVEKNTPVFYPLFKSLGNTAMGIFSPSQDAINRMCNSIEYHTNARIQERLEESYIQTSEEVIEDLIEGDHITITPDLEVAVPEGNALQWARQVVMLRNPWEALDLSFPQIQLSETCSEGLIVLMQDALRIANECHGLMQTMVLGNLKDMARLILRAAKSDFARFEQEEREKMPHEKKAIELYRKWHSALAWIGSQKKADIFPYLAVQAAGWVTDLQSASLNELENPDWIQSYTGEVDMTKEDRITVKVGEGDEITAYAAEFNIIDRIKAWTIDDPLFIEAARIAELVGSELPKIDRNFGERLIRAIQSTMKMGITENVEIGQFNVLMQERSMRSLAVTESFDSEDEIEMEYHEDDLTEVSEWDVTEPMWMTAQNDMRVTAEYEDLKSILPVRGAKKVIRETWEKTKDAGACKLAFHSPKIVEKGEDVFTFPSPCDDIIRWLNEHMVVEQFQPKAWLAMCKKSFAFKEAELVELNTWYRSKPKGYKQTLYSLTHLLGKDNAQIATDWLSEQVSLMPIVDVAYLFLSLESDFGFDDEDAKLIKTHGTYPTLYDWLEQFEEECVENLNLEGRYDPSVVWGEEMQPVTNSAKIEEIGAKNVDRICEMAAANCARLRAAGKKVDAFSTPEFIRAVMETNINSRVTVFMDTDGKWKSLSQTNGWAAWMKQFNPFAFKAYLAARAVGKSVDEAKSAFWECVKTPAAKKLETITGMTAAGLTLSSGRKVDWGIAFLKFKNNEIEITPEKRASLKEALTSRNLAPQLVSIL